MRDHEGVYAADVARGAPLGRGRARPAPRCSRYLRPRFSYPPVASRAAPQGEGPRARAQNTRVLRMRGLRCDPKGRSARSSRRARRCWSVSPRGGSRCETRARGPAGPARQASSGGRGGSAEPRRAGRRSCGARYGSHPASGTVRCSWSSTDGSGCASWWQHAGMSVRTAPRPCRHQAVPREQVACGTAQFGHRVGDAMRAVMRGPTPIREPRTPLGVNSRQPLVAGLVTHAAAGAPFGALVASALIIEDEW